MRRGALVTGIVVAGVIAAAVAVVAATRGGDGAGTSAATLIPVAKRTEAKPFSVPELGGGTLTLASLRGKPVVLNFWASWCVPCKRETPALVAFQKAHPGMRVVGVAVNDQPGDSRKFARRYGIPYPLGSDPDGNVGQGTYGIPGLPSTFVIDPQGRMATAPAFGPVDAAFLNAVAKGFGG